MSGFDHKAVLLPLRAVSLSNVFTAFLCYGNGLTYVFLRVVLTACNFASLPSFDGSVSPPAAFSVRFTLSPFSPFFVCEAGNGSKVIDNRKSIRLPKANDAFVPCVGLNYLCAMSQHG